MSHINRVSFDLETLGLTTDAVILQIGAAFIDPFGTMQTFLHTASVDSQPSRAINQHTVAWWEKQSPEVKAQVLDPANAPDAPSLELALTQLSAWLLSVGRGAEIEVYGNGAAFDLGMLNHAFASYGLATPWHYRKERDQRTLEALAAMAGCDLRWQADERDGHHHNALSDAIYQARRIFRLHNELQAKFTS